MCIRDSYYYIAMFSYDTESLLTMFAWIWLRVGVEKVCSIRSSDALTSSRVAYEVPILKFNEIS